MVVVLNEELKNITWLGTVVSIKIGEPIIVVMDNVDVLDLTVVFCYIVATISCLVNVGFDIVYASTHVDYIGMVRQKRISSIKES